MTIEQLRTAYQAQSFRPFVIHLADGRAVPVEHREFIMTVPSGRTVVIAQPDDTLNTAAMSACGLRSRRQPAPSAQPPIDPRHYRFFSGQ